ncbi:MAG: hypothetical protein KAR17_14315, partial [Cyclobacteriaceae bacterium]|nr:hypothetical protein [Cyclobacteriaceae bacterium]
QPPGLWKPIKKVLNIQEPVFQKQLLIQSFLGIVACFGLAILTNALFADNVNLLLSGIFITLISAFLLIRNIRKSNEQKKIRVGNE